MRTLCAEQVIVAAGTYNTQRLLHRMKDERRLPRLSSMLGRLSRTNSESILGAVAESPRPTSPRAWRSRPASTPSRRRTSSPCRYGKGSNSMGLLQSVLTTPRPGSKRWRAFAAELVTNGRHAASLLDVRQLERAVDHLARHADRRQLADRHGRADAAGLGGS